MMHTYTIGEPIEAVPVSERRNKPRDTWTPVYQAAHSARGQWVPVTFADKIQARNLVEIAKKRRGMDAETRGCVAYLRVRG